ncbi:hypothetical protein Tco_0487361 [Tanacetum coccineum]
MLEDFSSNSKVDGDLRKLSGEEAWETIDRFAQVQKEWDNPFKVITEKELTSLRAQENELFGNEKMWIEMLKCIAWDKVDNPSPQSTRQVISSFEVIFDEESLGVLRSFMWTILR